LRKYFSNKKFHRPDLVLSVNDAGGQEDKFFALGSSSSIYAFHGTKSENMFSILQHGLINNLNERAAFGEGTYLSTEIDVALGFAPSQRVRIPVRYFFIYRKIQFLSIAWWQNRHFNSYYRPL